MIQRDLCAGPHRLRSGRCQSQVLLAEDCLDPDSRVGVAAEPESAVVDAELDAHVGLLSLAGKADAGDLADLDAGDAYLVAGREAAGVAECGGVAGAAADDRQVLDVERAEHQGAEHGQADEAGDRRPASVQWKLHRPPPEEQRADGALNSAGLTEPTFGSRICPSKPHMKKLNQEPSDAVPVSAWY